MSKEWRPDDWNGKIMNLCPDETCPMKEAEDAYLCVGCGYWDKKIEPIASAMLYARDKWWMQQVERMGMSRKLETYVYGNDKLKDDYICIRFTDWQSLKQSMEVKK